jgi:hypothetical protein
MRKQRVHDFRALRVRGSFLDDEIIDFNYSVFRRECWGGLRRHGNRVGNLKALVVIIY